ncbi:MAG: hypothetical protein WBV80_08155 [Mycobacterium sp.]
MCSRGFGRLDLLVVGLGIGAALACTTGVASADSSTEWSSSIDRLLGGLSVPAADPAQAVDMQISIGGTLLFPYEDNTAFAFAGPGDIAVAIGNNSYASAQNGAFDFAFADGANSFAEAEIGNFDVAVADGADSVAKAGEDAALIPGLLSPTSFDTALVFGDDSTALAGFEGINNTVGFFDLAAAFGDNLLAQAVTAPFLVDIVP